MDISVIIALVVYLLATLVAIILRSKQDSKKKGDLKQVNSFKRRFRMWLRGCLSALVLGTLLANVESLAEKIKGCIFTYGVNMLLPPLVVITIVIAISVIVFCAAEPIFAAVLNVDELD